MCLKQNRPDRSYRDTLLNATPAKTTKRLLQLVLPHGGVLSHTRSGATILADPGADSGREGKSKRAKKCGTKESKERREQPLVTMSYQTCSKRSQPFWLLIGARKLLCFSAQSEARMAMTVWNWSGKTLSPGALLAVLYFSSCHIFPPV